MRISHISSRSMAFAIIFGLCATYAPHAKSIDWKRQRNAAAISSVAAVATGVTFAVIAEKEKNDPPPIIRATLAAGFLGIIEGASTGLVEGFISKDLTEALKGLFRGAISGGLAGVATGTTVCGIIRLLNKKKHEKQPTHETSENNPKNPTSLK